MMSPSLPGTSAIAHHGTPPDARSLTIREAVSADAPDIARFARDVFLATFGPGTTPANDPDDLHAYVTEAFGESVQLAELEDPTRSYLLAEIGDALVGFALLRVGATDAAVTGEGPVEIQRFYIDHRWHGAGVASRLMARCIETAKARGGKTLWLGVWEFNPRAIRFYIKQGFTDVGSHPFLLGKDLQTDRVMQRALHSAVSHDAI